MQEFVSALEFGVTGAVVAGDGNVVAAFGTPVTDGGDALLTVPLLRSKSVTAAMDAYSDGKGPYAPHLQQVGERSVLATVREAPFPFGEGDTALVLSAHLATFERLGARGVGAGAATAVAILLGVFGVFVLVSRAVAGGGDQRRTG